MSKSSDTEKINDITLHTVMTCFRTIHFRQRCKKTCFKVVIISDLEQGQNSAYNAEHIIDLPETLQVPSLCCFS